MGPIPRAYVLVGGYTKEGARGHAKIVSRVLRERLPTAHIVPPFFLKFDPKAGKYLFRIVVYELNDRGRCKSVLAELALQGSV
jgi:hypothetical protein